MCKELKREKKNFEITWCKYVHIHCTRVMC